MSLRKPEIDMTAAKPEAAIYRAIGELDKETIRKGSKSNNAKVCKRPKMNGILQFSSFFSSSVYRPPV